MKDNILQRKLIEAGLSASGNRQLMEKRYTEWVTLWNANCDARNPKGKPDLKREMDVWEKTQGGGSHFSRGREINIKDKDFDQAAYSVKHDDSFRDLIAQARKKRTAKVTEPANAEVAKPQGSGVATSSMPPPGSYSSPRPTQLSTADATMVDVPSSKSEPLVPASSPGHIVGQRMYEESSIPSVLNPLSSQELAMNSDISTIRVPQP
jgi:E3 ubiquitin-protein ligase RAD18